MYAKWDVFYLPNINREDQKFCYMATNSTYNTDPKSQLPTNQDRFM